MKRLLVGLALAAGCARTQHVQMEPLTFERGPGGQLEVIDPPSLFARAQAAFDAQKWAEAARDFDRLAQSGDERYADAALYDAGLAWESLHDPARAADRYRQVIARHHARPDDLLDARFRLGAALSDGGKPREAAEVYAELARGELTLPDRLEALTRRGAALLAAGDLPAAEAALKEPLALFHAHEQEERPEQRIDRFFPAMAAFELGEVAHEQFRRQPLRLDTLADDVDQKAKLLLDAEARYLDAMKLKHVEWATAAASQVGALYRELHDALLQLPVPPELDAEARKVYTEEVSRQLQGLLRRALQVHEQTVELARRVGVANEWVERSNAQMEELRRLLAPTGTPSPLPPAPREPLPIPKPRGDFHPRPAL